MKNVLRLNLALTGMLLVLTGCTQPIQPEQEEQPIVGGTPTTGDPGVVLIVAKQASGGGSGICTASVVSPHVIMTAAHCLNPDVVGQGTTFDLFIGNNVRGPEAQDPTKWLKIAETHYDTGFNAQQPNTGHDIGVVILSQPTTIKPVPMNRTSLTQSMVGQNLRLVGFGITSGSDQQGSSAGTKRETTTPMTDVDAQFVQYGDATKGTCQGDSGGPAFMTIGGTEVIVGVTSFGAQGCASGGYDTRIDTVGVPFVDPYIMKHDPASPPPPPGPPPSPGDDAGPGGADDGGVGGGGSPGESGNDTVGSNSAGGVGGCSAIPTRDVSVPGTLLLALAIALLRRRCVRAQMS